MTGGPEGMAAALHGQQGRLSGAIPVDAIARSLDVTEIRREALDSCEGMLLTDRMRNHGKILVNTRGGSLRARFSIAHELGHFLLESHALSDAYGFVCDREDMRESRERTRLQRQEREANRFAIELLAPRYRLNAHRGAEPDLRSVLKIRDDLEISLEAALRRYVDLHDQPLAAIMSEGGTVRYAVRQNGFPWIKLQKGDRVPGLTRAGRVISAGRTGVTQPCETHAAAWIRNAETELFEQSRLGKDGFAVTLLWASPQTDESDEEPLEELGDRRFHKRRRR